MEQEIIYIEAELIKPHPDNPRKNLGDLSELTESIKQNGIMQNLTVIPGEEEGEYVCLIGHRRLQAAKNAGLKYVPAVVTKDLDAKAQLAIMLEENMQRTDLTIVEQAQGFQMMLDLGETEKSIAEKTGFSRQTVKNRMELAKLNPETLEKAVKDDQITITDLLELQKIKDVDLRNKILSESETKWDIVRRVNGALQKAKEDKAMEKLLAVFDEAGIEKAKGKLVMPKWSGDIVVCAEYNLYDLPKEIEVPERQKQLYWNRETFGSTVYVYSIKDIKEIEKRDKERQQQEEEIEKRKERKANLEGVFTKLEADVKDFILRIISGEFSIPTKEELNMWQQIFPLIEKGMDGFFDAETMWEETKYEEDEAREKLPLIDRALALCYAMSFDKKTWDWGGSYNKEQAEKIYDLIAILEKCGYSMNDEEILQLLDGSHDAYTQE